MYFGIGWFFTMLGTALFYIILGNTNGFVFTVDGHNMFNWGIFI